MATEFQMPKLGLTMEEGKILQWLVPNGAEITPGTAILLIETDKVETEVEAVAGGRIVQIGSVGDSFPCGAPIGWVLGPGETVPGSPPSSDPIGVTTSTTGTNTALVASAVAPPTAGSGTTTEAGSVGGRGGGRRFVSPNAKRVAASLGVDVAVVIGTGPDGRVVSEDVEAAAANRVASNAQTASASPPSPASLVVAVSAPSGRSVEATAAAQQLAQLLGIDLRTAGVSSLSPDGRIGRDDVAEHVRGLIARTGGMGSGPSSTGPGTTASGSGVAFAPLLQAPSSLIPMKGMRNTIASRMHGSLREMAQLTLAMDVDMDAVVADRDLRKGEGAAPGYTDYIIAAAAKALRTHPIVNSQLTADGVALLPEIHVGMAVALDVGLVVPVIRNTDTKPLAEIASETTRLAQAARAGGLKLPDLEGGTFSVTALGMFGVDAFTPVINPPNVAILGVGRLRDDVAWNDRGIARVKRLTLSLTWDHRVLDGAPAAEFCRTVKAHLEDPATLG